MSAKANRKYKRRLKQDPLAWRAYQVSNSLTSRKVKPHPGLQAVKRILAERIRCRYCHKVVPPYRLSIDHIVPVSRGGSFSIRNIQFICARCNYLKANWTHEEYQEYLNLAQNHRFLKRLLEIRTSWHK